MSAAFGVAKTKRARTFAVMMALGCMVSSVLYANGPTVIKTDASWGRTAAVLAPVATATTVTGNTGTVHQIPGGVYTIPQSLGRTAGANLFHSFETFRVGTGDAAVFTTSSPLNNVISRVSGLSATQINGLVALLPASGTAPNFFFINPIGQALTVAGGDVRIDNGYLITQGGGDVRVIAIGGSTLLIPLTGVLPAAQGTLDVVNGAFLIAASLGARNGGNVSVAAGNINIDGRNSGATFTGIATAGLPGNSGSAGNIMVAAAQTLSVVDGGLISSRSYSTGNAGAILVTAGEMVMVGQIENVATDIAGASVQTGISNCACLTDGPATAGGMTLDVRGALQIFNGAEMFSKTLGSGTAGPIKVSAGSMLVDTRASLDFTGIQTQTKGAGYGAPIEVSVGGHLEILSGGGVVSYAFARGSAGSIRVDADSIYIDEQTSPYITGIVSQARVGSLGSAGNVQVSAAGNIEIVNGGEIAADTWAGAAAGALTVSAASMTIDGRQSQYFTGLSTQTEASGDAGTLRVYISGALSLRNSGEISSSSFGEGNAGALVVHAGNILIDGEGNRNITGISSDAFAQGDAGRVQVATGGALTILNLGTISSVTYAEGAAGSVEVTAGSLRVDGGNTGFARTGILAMADVDSTGRAGEINVQVQGELALLDTGFINSSTGSSRDAGSIKIQSGSMIVDAHGGEDPTGVFSTTTAGGNAGKIDIAVGGTLQLLNAGTIAASTTGTGNAGSIKVAARDIIVDGQNAEAVFGIQAFATTVGLGNAGDITVSATQGLSVLGGGFISSSTFSARGHAGSVAVDAATILVDGSTSEISASAHTRTPGQTGSVIVSATEALTLSNGGALSIRNEATVANPASVTPTLLSVSAPDIKLQNGGQISAESSGNLPASDILVRFTDRLVLDPSSITTSAELGNGGAIRIEGGKLVVLDNSLITTSVAGVSGNGGDISLRADVLVMNSGFIQANTAGAGASGGNVLIDVHALVPSGDSLSVGGSEQLVFRPGVFGFNVIQAASRTGVSGAIEVTAPELDIAGSLRGLSADVVNLGTLPRDLCRVGANSSLTPLGRGGLRPNSSGMIRPDVAIAIGAEDRQSANGEAGGTLPKWKPATLTSSLDCRY